MSQSGEELLNRINATLDVLQDAQEEAVEAVRDVATHKADPQAHGEAIAAAVEAAVSEALGGASGGGGSGESGEDGGPLVDRLSALENRFDGSGKLRAANLPLTDAVNSATGQLAASDTAVKTAYDKAAATAGLWIGVPRPWRGTALPPDHCWANGDFVAFADWPELKDVYEAGGFAGLLLDWDADSETQAAQLGRWRPDAAAPTGLYTPNLTGQFLRCWGPGIERQAGSWQADAFQGHGHLFYAGVAAGSGGGGGYINFSQSNKSRVVTGPESLDGYGTARIADETRPANIALPVIIYLGQPAQPEELA